LPLTQEEKKKAVKKSIDFKNTYSFL